jgi:hypothetical protein
MRSRGVPVEGVGLQGHFGTDAPSQGELGDALERYAGLGLKTAFTELDVRLPVVPSEPDLVQQQQIYRRVAAACMNEPSCEGVTTWGFTDKLSWIPIVYPGDGAALPFDDGYRPKPAYYGLREGLGERTDIVDVYQAETADQKAGGEQAADAWRLASGGSVVSHVAMPRDGRYRFTVVAQTEGGTDQAPAHMHVLLDGAPIGEADISAAGLTPYAFETSTTAGQHDLAVAYTSDASEAQGGRNLLVDRTTVAERLAGADLSLTSNATLAGGEWQIGDGGAVGTPVAVPETGTYDIAVTARSSAAEAAGMRLMVDGTPTTPIPVGTGAATDYVFQVRLEAGHHHVLVTQTSGAPGSLVVGSLVLGTAGSAAPTR